MIGSGLCDATAAKLAAQRVRGVRAVSFQRLRGREYLVISAETHGKRQSREVPVMGSRLVQTSQITHALNVLVGRDAAEAYRP